MHWLVLAIFLDFGFLQLFKLGQRQQHAAPVIIAFNYLTMGLVILLYLAARQTRLPPPAAVVTGVVAGVAFVASMLVMNHALRVASVGPVLTSFRMSIVVPLALGILLWNEAMSTSQLGGLLLTLGALVLMTVGLGAGGRRTDKHLLGLLILVFAVQGLCYTVMRSVHYARLDEHIMSIIAIAGLTAGLLGFAFVLYLNVRITARAAALGAGIGLYNTVSMPVVMLALSHLPGTTYFPIAGCSVVVLDNLCAHYVWGEKLTRPAVIGVVVAVLALGLILA